MARLVYLGELKPGEDKLVQYLQHSLGDEYTVFTRSTIRHGQREREMDVLLLGPQAIFVLEAKNWEGTVSGSDNGPWTQQRDSEKVEERPNPLDQVDDTWKALGGFLEERLPHLNVWIQPIVVFTHPRCNPTWSVSFRDIPVMRLEQLASYVSSLPTKVGKHPLSLREHEMIERVIKGGPEEPLIKKVAGAWSCPSCGTKNDPQARFCIKCRFDIIEYRREQERLAELARKQAELEADKAAGVELCPSCGKFRNRIDAAFCGGCGADLQEYKRKRKQEERRLQKRKDIRGQFLYAFTGACLLAVILTVILLSVPRGITLSGGYLLLVFLLPPSGALLGITLFLDDVVNMGRTYAMALLGNVVSGIIAIRLYEVLIRQLGWTWIPIFLEAALLIGVGMILALGSALGVLIGLER